MRASVVRFLAAAAVIASACTAPQQSRSGDQDAGGGGGGESDANVRDAGGGADPVCTPGTRRCTGDDIEDCAGGNIQGCVANSCNEGVTYHAIECQCAQ